MSLVYVTRTYYLLTKPGIILGNIITMTAGFALAAKGQFPAFLFMTAAAGIALIIASACVFNNYIDRKADAKMERTQGRALAKGVISTRSALFFALAMGLIGAALLGIYTNFLTLSLALLGAFVYLVLYSFSKYFSVHATLLGSIAGAMPPLVGYSAVSGRVDLPALVLFSMIVLWQMPHFYAIALYHLDDYARASLPVLPVKKGVAATKVQMLLYVIAFTAVSCALAPYLGYFYLALVLTLGSLWLALCVQGFTSKELKPWARKMFVFSLLVVTLISFTIILISS